MFEYQRQSKPNAPVRAYHGWNVALAVFSLAGLTVLGGAMWIAERPASLTEVLDQAEREVVESVTRLIGAPQADAKPVLRRTIKRWAGWRRDIQKWLDQAEPPAWESAQRDRALKRRDALDTLIRLGREGQAQLAGKDNNALLWEEFKANVVAQMNDWPTKDSPVGSPIRPRDLGRQFRQGLLYGAGWPVAMVRRTWSGNAAGYGFFRRVLFPHGAGFRPGLFFLLGFGLASIGIGYGFCWAGMHWNRAGASYAGLCWFVHLIVFGSGLVGLRLGVLS